MRFSGIGLEPSIVRSRLIGSVRALTVTLEANSHVEADLLHKSLSFEQGTHFDGDSHPRRIRYHPAQKFVRQNRNGTKRALNPSNGTNG
jgi:hypothetical protein